MTERLYYDDPYLREFDATVQAIAERDGHFVVTLDRTAFYPTSGGQPFDVGTLGGFNVVDVVDQDDGSIAHVLARSAESLALHPSGSASLSRLRSPADSGSYGEARRSAEGADAAGERPLTVGTLVHGVIDWARRFEHMQQHTGQHVLSAAFAKLFGVRTVSFHLGAETSTIDLAREMTPAEIAATEDEANRVVWEDRPVSIRYATPEEAANLPLRKEPARGGTLRLIEVDGFDLSACGGTHVARTGAIGIIAVGSWERFKGGQRIAFLCGGRALTRFREMRDAVAAGVRLLSVLPHELPISIERLQGDLKEQKRATSALQEELARYRAGELAASAEVVRPKPGAADTKTVRLVLRAVDADASGLKSLAQVITSQAGYVAILISSSRPTLVAVARSADVGIAANQIVSSLTKLFGGRGGGKPELAQGGGLDAGSDAVLAAARDAFTASFA
jgi:alanyl-tRNA synthetase